MRANYLVAMVLGLGIIAQVSSTYGKGVADTIVENCGNTLILRCSASEHGGTAEFASKLIGQHQVTHTTRSTSRRCGEWRKSTTLSEQVNIEPAVMASEIERLPDLEGFLKFASIPDWHCVELAPSSGSSRARRKTTQTVTHAPTLADTSQSPFVPSEVIASSTAAPRATTQGVSKPSRKHTRKPRVCIDQADAAGTDGRFYTGGTP